MTDTQASAPPEGPPGQVSVSVDFSGDDLSLNERIDVEDACGGHPFEVLRDEGRSSFFRAVAWVVGRRNDPRFTLQEAGELMVRFDG